MQNNILFIYKINCMIKNVINMKQLKNLKKNLIDVSWVFFLKINQNLLSFIFLITLTHKVSQEFVGEFYIVLAGVGMASFFTFLGIPGTIIQSIARGYHGTFRKLIPFRLIGGLAGSIAISIFALTFPEESIIKNTLLIAALTFPLSHGLSIWEDYYSGLGNFKFISISKTIYFIVTYSVMIIMITMHEISMIFLIAVMYSFLAIINTIISLRILTNISPKLKAEPKSKSYFIKTSLYSIFNLLGNHIDKFLILYFLSAESVAIYIIAERLSEMIKRYTQSMSATLIPKLANHKRLTKNINFKINIFSIFFTIGILIVIFLIIPWFVPLAFTNAYADSVFYSQLLCGTIIIGQFATTKITFITSNFYHSDLKTLTMVSNFIRIISSLILIPSFGILGAIASTALYRLSTSLVMSILIKKYNIKKNR
jgi:O-antigen/teichoic acid export membrane protein